MTYPPEEPADRIEHVEIKEFPDGERRTVVVDDPAVVRSAETFRVTQIVWLLFGLLEGLIAIRILLRLLGANPASPFASLVYGITEPFLAPFAGLFGNPASGNLVLEISTIVAFIVYLLLAWLIARVLWLLLYRPAARRVSTVDRDIYR